jgi:hypothetical protein
MIDVNMDIELKDGCRRMIETHMVSILKKYHGDFKGLKSWYDDKKTYPSRDRFTEKLILPDDASCPLFYDLIKTGICGVVMDITNIPYALSNPLKTISDNSYNDYDVDYEYPNDVLDNDTDDDN